MPEETHPKISQVKWKRTQTYYSLYLKFQFVGPVQIIQHWLLNSEHFSLAILNKGILIKLKKYLP